MYGGPGPFLYVLFIAIGLVMSFYTLNFFYLAYQSRHNPRHERKRRQKIELPESSLPTVTVQLPLYNEKYVAERLVDAVCRMDYPKDKLQIQVLDDSDDDTVDLIRSIVEGYRFKGFDISHIHRTVRVGYKAGALKAGMKHTRGEFVAIFDADFIPPPQFLKKAIGHFFADPKIGLVQCRWGHVNENYSTLTEAQAVSLDLHFLVEQKAKSLTHLFMNFNGTAGIWRSSCIADAGGWHTSTLVEDLDLSYRAQMKGWKCIFLEDIVVGAELPVQMNAAKRQQSRWAKGAIQVSMKLMTDVVAHRKVPVDTKLQAFIQLTRHIVNPLFLAQFIIFPMLIAMDFTFNESWTPVLGLAIYMVMGPGGYLAVINRIWRGRWRDKARQFLYLMFFAGGISVNNTVAVFDGLFGSKNEFLRTPKFGIVRKDDGWRNKEYVLPFTRTTLLEIFFAIYGCIAIFVSLFSGSPVYAPMIAVPTVGFIYVAYLSITHSTFRKKRQTRDPVAGQLRTDSGYAPTIAANSRRAADILKSRAGAATLTATAQVAGSARRARGANQRAVLAGVLAFLVLGAGMAYYGYQDTIYPANRAFGFLARAEAAQTPQQLAEYLELTKKSLPEGGNPVWLFPTQRTNFGLIQENLDGLITRAESTEAAEPHTEAYNMAMMDMHAAITSIRLNLMEATPYFYISIANVILAAFWVGVILAVFAAMRRAKSRQQTI